MRESGVEREFRSWYRRSPLYRPRLVPDGIEWEDLVKALYRHRHCARGFLLDVGSRNRRYRPVFEGIVSTYVGLDLWSDAVRRHGGGDLYGDARALPLASNSVDTVLMTQVIGLIREYDLVLREAYRVLAPGGHLLLTWNQTAATSKTESHYFRFTGDFYRFALPAAGFELVAVEARSGTMAMVGETLSGFVYYRSLSPAGIVRRGLCLGIQRTFRWLDRLLPSSANPLGHIAVARKPCASP